jgi:hypothetical protein
LSDPGKFINMLIGVMIAGILALSSLSPFVSVAEGAPDIFNLHTNNTMDSTTGSSGSVTFTTTGSDFTWTSVASYPEGGDAGSIAQGNYTVGFYFSLSKSQTTRAITLEFDLSYGATTIGTVQSTFNGGDSSPRTVTIATNYGPLTLDENPAQPLSLRIRFISNNGGQHLTMYMDDPGVTGQTALNTPVVTVPEFGAVLAPIAAVLPMAILWRMRRRKLAPAKAQIA